MNKADWLAAAGFSSFGAGLYFVYRPLPLLFLGAVLILLARVARGK